MTLSPDQLEKVLSAAAALHGLQIGAEHRAGVLRYLALAAGMAEVVDAVPLTPADESGSVFRPVAPASGT